MAEHIRPAADADLEAMVRLASARRAEYAAYQPVFWRSAAGAEHRHWPFLARLVASSDVITLVSEECDNKQRGRLTGFVIATLATAPPVYDPGGLTGFIDDFAVEPGRWSTTGACLLQAALDAAAERGAVQTIVVTAHLDEAKRAMLQAAGLQLASEWWVADT